jgi:hypothetical protein
MFSVGQGTEVCFWLDWWCVDGVLKEVFLFGLPLGKILTIDNLRQCKVVFEWCYMCKKVGEAADHLLVTL